MTKNYQHAEAFCLMKYRSDDGTEEEWIWNSRDGVTPFVISLRSGKYARHVDWQMDSHLPDYVPPIGSRIFVDLTEERARFYALRHARRFFQEYVGEKYDPRDQYESPEVMAEELLQDYLSRQLFGRSDPDPDLIEVTQEVQDALRLSS